MSDEGGVAGLRREGDGGLLRLVLDRPAAGNTVDRAMLHALGDWLHEAGQQPALRAVVLTGAGDAAFSLGADVEELPGEIRSAQAAREFDDAWEKVVHRLEHLPALTVAVLNGDCRGRGLTLAMACDVRVAVPGARLSCPVLAEHLLPSEGDVERLRSLVGPARAKALLMAGVEMQGDAALAAGLVDLVVPADAMDATVARLVAPALAAGAAEIIALKRLGAGHADYMVVDLCYRAVYERDQSALRRLRED